MKPEQLYQQFEVLSERLGIRLVEDKGNFIGGDCLVDKKPCIVVNKRRPIEQKLRVLAAVFNELDLSSVYLMPALREYIEKVNLSLLNTQDAKKR